MGDKTLFQYESEQENTANSAVQAVLNDISQNNADTIAYTNAMLEDLDNISTEDFISVYMGDDWDGSFTDLTGFVESYAQDMASQLQYNSSIIEYFKSNKNIIANDAMTRAGIAQAQNNITLIQNEFNSLTQTVTNFKTFGFSSGSGDYINVAGQALDNLENIVTSMAGLEAQAEMIIEKLEAVPEMVGNIGDYFDKKMEQLSSLMDSDVNLDLMSTFPDAVLEKFLELDVVQDFFLLIKQISSSVTAIMTIIPSIQAPTNLKSTMIVIKQLKAIVAEARLAQDQIDRFSNIVEGLQTNLKKGNYIGFIISAAGGLKFIEKPSSYAAKYPYNSAYTTTGGHLLETDNTPGKERLHVRHKSGTDVEVSPNGDMVAKIKNDFQTVVEKNLEFHSKANMLLLVDKFAEIEAGRVTITAKDAMRLSAPSAVFSTDMLSIIGTDITMATASSTTISSGLSTSVSSIGPVYITSNSAIIMDAPSIIIGQGKCALLSLASSAVINSVAGSVSNSFAGSLNAITATGNVRVTGGLITLN